ncbi:hypothetical protein BIV25_20710 [Streptomyces sp. MUSC 14]|uniref:hypothetical protein n=1 Tax=Streptomyces sp. MUSC 14 TaxID=1354889 RepID=UPI0008F58727|nr:hypothetical protein [Streptomyces sp. MUSC 14]OIJ95053.1 hypothetical protein BIV25_20710 [Streptomyces sp. MUSC 14]
MPKPIRLALERTLALVLALLVPATGRRRRRNHQAPAPTTAFPRTFSGLRLLIRRTTPPGLLATLPARARAQAHAETPALLDGPGPLIRPYLLAHERRERQQERRAALVLALDGIDIGPWVIHGHRIGTPVAPLGAAAG